MRLAISKKFKDIRVLFNYGVLTHGFDAPNTEVMIILKQDHLLSHRKKLRNRKKRN